MITLLPDDNGKNVSVYHGQRREMPKMMDIVDLEELGKAASFISFK